MHGVCEMGGERKREREARRTAKAHHGSIYLPTNLARQIFRGVSAAFAPTTGSQKSGNRKVAWRPRAKRRVLRNYVLTRWTSFLLFCRIYQRPIEQKFHVADRPNSIRRLWSGMHGEGGGHKRAGGLAGLGARNAVVRVLQPSKTNVAAALKALRSDACRNALHPRPGARALSLQYPSKYRKAPPEFRLH